MLRADVAASLLDQHGEDGYLSPAYGDYCFAAVPATACSVLGADVGRTLPGDVLDGVDADVGRVLVVLVDGLGFRQWRRDRSAHPLLDRVTDRARVTPLTSVFPSETAAAIPTVHTGRLPSEHGGIGWDVYEPAADVAVRAFDAHLKGGTGTAAFSRADVFDAESLYPTLRERGIDPRHVVPFEETNEGATLHAYGDEGGDFAPTLVGALTAADPPAYVFAYLPHVDHAAHEVGTEGDAYRAALVEVFDRLEDAFAALDDEVAEDTLLLVTADHGIVDTDPERNVDLTQFDVVEDNLARHGDGSPVRFAGSPRNVHLHLRDGAVEEVASALRAELDARVFRREAVLRRSLCGDRGPSETFRRRVGDLVVVHRNLGVWFGGDVEPDDLDLVGMHGGLHPDEMLVPFAAVRLDRIL